MPSLTKYFTPRQLLFATFSFVVGVWTFIKVNEISGPAFEPIIEKCLSFSSFESMDAFVEETQLHEYNTFVGLKLFDLLVCLITQFLLELRNTYPAGLLTWSGVVLSAFGVAPTLVVESRRKGAKGLLIYPIVYGVLFQLFGVSVIFPLLWVPSYILGKGNGPVSVYCAKTAFWLNLPTVVLTTIVFVAHTDSYLWTLCAGILGGPMLALSSIALWSDVTPDSSPKENEISLKHVKRSMHLCSFVGSLGWFFCLSVAYSHYSSISSFWDDVWVNANSSVAFMTIDTCFLYVGAVIMIAYESIPKALKSLALLPILGPASASVILAELEVSRYDSFAEKKEA